MGNPYITTVIRCAGPNCDHIHGESNGWYMAHASFGEFSVYTWDEEKLMDRGYMPLCSQSCVSKLLSKFMSDLNVKEHPHVES